METNQSIKVKTLNPTLTGSLTYVFTFLAAGSWFPFLNVYLTELNLSGTQIGWLSILSPVMVMLFATAIAALADRTHRGVQFAQAAMAGAALSIFLLRLPKSFNGIAVLMLFCAVFSSPIMSLTDGLIARMAQRRHLNYGGMRLWGSLTFALAALAFGALWQIFGYPLMFLAASAFYLPLIWITGKLEEGPIVSREARPPMSSLFRDSGVVLLLLATVLSGISNSVFLIFGSVYAHSLGAGGFLIGLMIAFAGVAELPTMFYNDQISRRMGKVNTVILSYGLMGAAYLGYFLMTNPNFLPVFSILKGLGYGLWLTVTIRLLIDHTPEEWAATAQSLLTVCWFGLSPLLAGPVGGWLHDAVNPGAVFLLAIFSLVLAAVVLWLAARLRKLE
jgi:PPP family 3-phenylpropionic acid transporter